MDKIKKYLQTNRTQIKMVLKVFVWGAVATIFMLMLSPLVILQGVASVENQTAASPLITAGVFVLIAAPYILIIGGIAAGLLMIQSKSTKNRVLLSIFFVLCQAIAYIMLSNPAFH